MEGGWSLQFVKEQTYEICLEAMKQNRYSLNYVRDPLLKARLALDYK